MLGVPYLMHKTIYLETFNHSYYALLKSKSTTSKYLP